MEPRGIRNNNPLNIRFVEKNTFWGSFAGSYPKILNPQSLIPNL